jgi:sporulation protein YlmC with PRC-barrel domain
MRAGQLLRLPVRLRGIQLGRVADVVLDVERRRALGLQVACGDEVMRFLPLAVAEVDEGEIRVTSPLVLLDPGELAFYTSRGSTYGALRDTSVVRRTELLGRLDDLVVERDGTISRLVVGRDGGREEVAYARDVELGAPGTHVLAS